MAQHTYLKVLDITETRNPETGELRIAAACQEVNPRSFNINLSNKSADILNQFQSLKGKMAMVPLREGQMNGRPFFALEQGEIIEIPSAPAAVPTSTDNADKDKPSPLAFGKQKAG